MCTNIYLNRYGHVASVFNDRIWIVGGMWKNETARYILASFDGAHWSKTHGDVSMCNRISHECTVFSNRLWMIGGRTYALEPQRLSIQSGSGIYQSVSPFTICDHADAWSTVDGEQWICGVQEDPLLRRHEHIVIPLVSDIVVIGGNRHRDECVAVRSKDGQIWNPINDRPLPPGRYGYRSTLHENKWYCSGGRSEIALSGIQWVHRLHNDVWSSTDGLSWRCICHSAPWSPRYLHGFVTLGEDMYVFGGISQDGTGWKYHSDMWKSCDGRRWSKCAYDEPALCSQGFSAVVFQNHIWIIGGWNENPNK